MSCWKMWSNLPVVSAIQHLIYMKFPPYYLGKIIKIFTIFEEHECSYEFGSQVLYNIRVGIGSDWLSHDFGLCFYTRYNTAAHIVNDAYNTSRKMERSLTFFSKYCTVLRYLRSIGTLLDNIVWHFNARVTKILTI